MGYPHYLYILKNDDLTLIYHLPALFSSINQSLFVIILFLQMDKLLLLMNKCSSTLYLKKAAFFISLLLFTSLLFAQNPRIKCYFNHPVNTGVSGGNNAVYLNGTFPDTIAAYINRAHLSVDVALYNFTASSSSSVAIIATAINNAWQRGVAVRWIYNGSSGNSGLNLLNASIPTLGSPTSASYGIMHNKFMIVDADSPDSTDAFVVTGSYNWSDQQTNGDYNNLLILQSKSLAAAFINEFNKMWGGSSSTPNLAASAFGTHKISSGQHLFNINGTTVEVYFSPKDTVGDHFKACVNSANNELFFGIYTFTDSSFANLIKSKISNSVIATGIMDQFSLSYMPYSILSPVMGANLKVYSSSAIYHNKVMLVDAAHPLSDPQVFTGSFNWSISAQNSNDENAVIVHDAIIANQYWQSLCSNFVDAGGAACSPVTAIETLPVNEMLFSVYPNPVVHSFVLTSSQFSTNDDILIYNNTGQLIKQQPLKASRQYISVNDLPSGIYYLALRSDHHRHIVRIVKL